MLAGLDNSIKCCGVLNYYVVRTEYRLRSCLVNLKWVVSPTGLPVLGVSHFLMTTRNDVRRTLTTQEQQQKQKQRNLELVETE